MYNFLQEYSDNNPEKFNEELIYLKENDDVLEHINSIFKALEVIDGVHFMGVTVEKDESAFPDYIVDETKYINVEESRYIKINFKFHLVDSNTGEECDVEKFIFFPKLINKTYFILNGNKYFPIYQIIDSATYNNGNSLTLKTLLMGVTIRTKPVEYFTIFDEGISGNIKIINLFKNKINYFYYYFADKGFFESIKYFIPKITDKDIYFTDTEPKNANKIKDTHYIFKLINRKCDEHLVINKSLFESHPNVALNIVDMCIGRHSQEILNKDYWLTFLGSTFSRNKNNYEKKADDILISFKRILDDSTKKSLRLKDKNKRDIFALVRWMIMRFEMLIQRDNMDLKYKRIRINEYLLYDLLIKMSRSTYRLLNKQEITLKDRTQLFSTLGPMFVIKKIATNELCRYFGGVNAIELFNPSLKFSMRGFQGLGEGSKNVNKNYRGLHPSYIGRIGLTASSAGDPGMSGTFTPFLENHGFYFTDDVLDEEEDEYDE